MNRRRSVIVGLLFALLLGLFTVTAVATIRVPGEEDTIKDALAAADPGETIYVDSSYDFSDETFPILVQQDDIVIDGNGAVFPADEDTGDSALFAVGVKRYVDKDTGEELVERVSGVTIRDFVVKGDTQVAFVVKHADGVIIEDNVIDPYSRPDDEDYDNFVLEGIRLIDATEGEVLDNMIVGVGYEKVFDDEDYLIGGDGIGIVVQNSRNNFLSGNIVTHSGLGLFVYNSSDDNEDNNVVTGDTYEDNLFGGLVVNDSNSNEFWDLMVGGNGYGESPPETNGLDGNGSLVPSWAWGVRFVYADDNVLGNSEVYGNNQGGIQLLASQYNDVDGNLVYSNGTADDGDDDAQIVITRGDKEKIVLERDLSWEDFVDQKHTVEKKILLLYEWLESLNVELEEIPKEVGDGNYEEAAARLRAILGGLGSGQIYAPYGIISKNTEDGSVDGDGDPIPVGYDYQNADVQTAGVIIEPKTYTYDGVPHLNDSDQNFTLEDTTVDDYTGVDGLADDIDKWTDDEGSPWAGEQFALNYSATEPNYSWGKLGLIDMLIDAARYEIYDWDVTWENDVETRESLMDMLEDFHDDRLITDKDYEELSRKLVGRDPEDLEELDPKGAAGFLDTMEMIKDDGDRATSFESANDIVDYVYWLYGLVDQGSATAEDARNVRDAVEELTVDIEDYAALVEENLCRVDIELTPLKQVNTSTVAKKEKPFSDIGSGWASGWDKPSEPEVLNTYETAYLEYVNRESSHNLIESNTITSRLENTDDNVGIVIESPYNDIVNNLISNEGGMVPGEDPLYEEVRPGLDYAMYLLSSNNLIAHNAIEFVDHGIIRGGYWERRDYQLDYFASQFPLVADWPYSDYTVEDWCGTHVAGDFDNRPTDWIPVFSLQQGKVSISYDSVKVKGNALARNFFDHAGTGIEIVDAESNDIFSNLFYKVDSGNIIFGKDTSSGINLAQNDHYAGFAIINNSDYAVDASEDYTPPEGEPGHAKTDSVGKRVTPPSTTVGPHCQSNFINEDAEAWYDDEGLGYIYNGEFPPNMDYIFDGVTLPEEKPRVCSKIFNYGTENPVAEFTAEEPTSGEAPLTVDFDASASHDQDNVGPSPEIVKYEWDFDNDGTWDLTKTSSDTDPALASHEYTVTGTYSVTLRVTDNDDETDTLTKDNIISVGGGGGNWKTGLAVESPNFSDQTAFGVETGASDCLGPEDIEEPPPAIDYTDLYFNLPTSCSSDEDLTEDIRMPVDFSSATKTWDPTVTTTESAGTTIELSWNSGDFNLPAGASATLRDTVTSQTVDMLAQESYSYTTDSDDESRDFEIVVSGTGCTVITHEITTGWNMFSVPGNVCGSNDPGDVFGDDLGSGFNMYRWDPVAGGYDVYPTESMPIEPQYGQWFKDGEGVQLDAEVQPITSDYTFTFQETGWHQIGYPFNYATSWEDATVTYNSTTENIADQSWVSSYVYSWDPGVGNYVRHDADPASEYPGTLEPWKAYWVLVNDASVELTLSSTQVQATAISSVQKKELGKMTREKGLTVPPPPPLANSTEGPLEVVAYNNTGTSYSYVTFAVTGENANVAEGMKVEVMNANGDKVFSTQSAKTSIVWETEGVANGVYIYEAFVKKNGSFARTNVSKLLILK